MQSSGKHTLYLSTYVLRSKSVKHITQFDAQKTEVSATLFTKLSPQCSFIMPTTWLAYIINMAFTLFPVSDANSALDEAVINQSIVI